MCKPYWYRLTNKMLEGEDYVLEDQEASERRGRVSWGKGSEALS